MFEPQCRDVSPERGHRRKPQGLTATLPSSETDEIAPPTNGGDGTFGMVRVTVLIGSTVVTETESAGGGVVAGGGVAAGGGVVAGGSFGAGDGSFGVAGSGAGSAVVAELDVAGGDEGAGVDDVVPVAGSCVVLVDDVVPPVAGGAVEEVEPDDFDGVFAADAGAAAVLPCDVRTGLAGTTAAVLRAAASARWRCVFAGAGAVADDRTDATGCAFVVSTAGASRFCSWPTAGSSLAIATVRSTAADAIR